MIKCFLKQRDGFFKYTTNEEIHPRIVVPFRPTVVEMETGDFRAPKVRHYKREFILQRTFLDEFDNQVAVYEEI